MSRDYQNDRNSMKADSVTLWKNKIAALGSFFPIYKHPVHHYLRKGVPVLDRVTYPKKCLCAYCVAAACRDDNLDGVVPH
jgi:hypothetical protein